VEYVHTEKSDDAEVTKPAKGYISEELSLSKVSKESTTGA